ncbi:hypothetical protein GF327_04700 [Candidatus Woesearchaeota archaeon]|nr:hypothetical protein [Candidatus Woesearchaeota archaeon]
MIDDLKKFLKKQDSVDSQKEEKKDTGLIKFDFDLLKEYPFFKIRLVLCESPDDLSFKIENKDKKIIRENALRVYSEKPKIHSLINQLKEFSKKSRYDKYKRKLYQSKLLNMYKQKHVNEEFVESFANSIPEEYEIQIFFNSENGFKIDSEVIKIFTDNIELADELEKEIDNFRQNSYNIILKNKVDELKKKYEFE